MSAFALVCLVGAAVASVPRRSVLGRLRRRAPQVTGMRARRSATPREPAELDAALLLDVVDAALGAGAPIPRALQAVGALLGGASGAALVRAGGALVLGAPWSAAWAGAPPMLDDLADGLEQAWSSGAAPGPALRARAAQVRSERRGRTRAAAATLGVHLVLPLGLCFLPAFVLLGLVPLVLSLASGLVLG